MAEKVLSVQENQFAMIVRGQVSENYHLMMLAIFCPR
jgi:hypothetical protein